MPDILALCSGREGRRIVEDQLRNVRAEVAYTATRSELRIAVAESDVRVVVSDIFDGDGRPMAAFLRDLNYEFPELKIILSYDPSPAALDDVLDAATSGARYAFAARPFNHLGRLVGPLLMAGSMRPPSAADNLIVRVVPRAETTFARRFLTFASVNPIHRLNVKRIARYCGTTERTLCRHLEMIGPPRMLLNALAWPQANYLISSLRWRPKQVASYFGFDRPVFLIDLLTDYVESGLWQLGLDTAVDGIAALTAEAQQQSGAWLHHSYFHPCNQRDLVHVMGHAQWLDQVPWSCNHRNELGHRILMLLGTGAAPMEIVRRLWRRYDVAPGYLYRAVMHVVYEAHASSRTDRTVLEEKPSMV